MIKNPTCSVTDCERKTLARGLCRRHWERWRKGDTSIVAAETTVGLSAIEKLQRTMSEIDLGFTSPCWYTTYATNTLGYAAISDDGPVRGAHVVSYEHYVGPVPEGKQVDHRCHPDDGSCAGGPSCPHRRCWNHEHLKAVPQGENVARGMSPGAISHRTGICTKGLHSMEDAYRDSRGHKYCRHCHNAKSLAAYHARKKTKEKKMPKEMTDIELWEAAITIYPPEGDPRETEWPSTKSEAVRVRSPT